MKYVKIISLELELSEILIDEVAYHSGFEDVKYFSKVYNKWMPATSKN